MTPITLETINAEQSRLAAEREQIHFPETLIDLNPGEHYAGLIVGKDGEPSYHLILLPGEAENVTFDTAKKWAASIGGDLPTRLELALLWQNCRDQFEKSWYWSNESSEAGWAWYQHFYYGFQTSHHVRQDYQLRARAVRRLPI